VKRTSADSPRLGGDAPDLAALKTDWSRCVNDRQTNYWTRQRLNWESRYCVWKNQTSDGRKWPANNKTRVWPWPGAADSRVALVDKYLREDIALLMQVFQNNRILVRPNSPARDAAWANRLTSLLRWLVYEEMQETEAEAEYLANLLLERGTAALGIWWHREETLTRETLELEPLLQAAQQAQMRLARGEQGDALNFQALLPQLIMDPTLEAQALTMIQGLTPEGSGLTNARLKQSLRELRETGKTQFPRPIVRKNRPCVRALAWNEDIWTPPETIEVQRSRLVFIREWLTEADIREHARAYEWEGNWVDAVLDTQKGRVTEMWTNGPARSRGPSWNALGQPDAQELYEVVTAYERLSDGDGIPGIYATVFSPGLADKEKWAASELLDYAHGQFPFAVWSTERRSRLLDDARGYGEVAATWQTQIKRQWDARIDRTDVATLPPSHHPPGEEPDAWGPGVQIPTLQPERFGYFESPKFDPGSKEVEETVRRFADEYFGRPVDEQNTVQAQLLQGELVRKWQAGWKQAFTQIIQLCQQYMPDEFYFRVVGGEQGRGIKATREEIQGPFNVTLKFNVRDLDADLVGEKLKLMERALAMDSNAIVDRNEAIAAAMELVDPGYAERLLRPAEAAANSEIKDEQDTLAKLLLGISVDLQGNEAFLLRKQTLTQLIQTNPTAQNIIGQNEQVKENVERRLKQLDFNIQQKMVNPDIGRRLGTKPNEQVRPAGMPMGGGMGQG
jgi:hypothetical protein